MLGVAAAIAAIAAARASLAFEPTGDPEGVAPASLSTEELDPHDDFRTRPEAPLLGAVAVGGSYRALRTAQSPEYGMNIFIWGAPDTTDRDLDKLVDLRFGWQKSLFQWRLIEPEKGRFDWREAERVVAASNARAIKVIARVDFQPDWARADRARNGPPDDIEDFADFVFALVDHFKPGSPHGSIGALEIWNEPNLQRDWGDTLITREAAAEYVQLLCAGHHAAKRANPSVITLTAGLTPTGTLGGLAVDDVVYLEWLYELGGQPCFDAVGAHGVGFKTPPWVGPEEVEANPSWGGHPSFAFRRVEQLREVMVRHGDDDRQVWLTEFGWTSDPIHPTFSWYRVDEAVKQHYVVEAFRWAYENWQPWIGVMVLWNMPAPYWTAEREEFWWSVTNPDGTTRPAYDALLAARRNGYLP